MRRTIAVTLSVLLWTFAGCEPGDGGSRTADEEFQRGEDFALGHGVDKNPREAVEWYKKAADRGHPTAQARLAVCYSQGKGVKKNPTEALRLFKLAAEQGQPKAQLELGLAYRDGRGVPQDHVQAAAWLMLSANFGSRIAKFMSTKLIAQMTEKQLDEARGIAHRWRAAHYSSRAGNAESPRGG